METCDTSRGYDQLPTFTYDWLYDITYIPNIDMPPTDSVRLLERLKRGIWGPANPGSVNRKCRAADSNTDSIVGLILATRSQHTRRMFYRVPKPIKLSLPE